MPNEEDLRDQLIFCYKRSPRRMANPKWPAIRSSHHKAFLSGFFQAKITTMCSMATRARHGQPSHVSLNDNLDVRRVSAALPAPQRKSAVLTLRPNGERNPDNTMRSTDGR